MIKNTLNRSVYITRDSRSDEVWIFPETVGIRKFHGCVAWGAAWCTTCGIMRLYGDNTVMYAAYTYNYECKKIFGFIPRGGTAYHVTAKGKRTKVDIDFTD